MWDTLIIVALVALAPIAFCYFLVAWWEDTQDEPGKHKEST